MNYKQAALETESWQRANRIVIENPLNGPVSYNFVEEMVIPNITTVPMGNLTGEVNFAETFSLLDQNGVPTGQIGSMAELQQMLFSLYIHLATQRDHNK